MGTFRRFPERIGAEVVGVAKDMIVVTQEATSRSSLARVVPGTARTAAGTMMVMVASVALTSARSVLTVGPAVADTSGPVRDPLAGRWDDVVRAPHAHCHVGRSPHIPEPHTPSKPA